MKKIRAVLITRSDPRHVYFCNFISRYVDLLEVFIHHKRSKKRIALKSAWRKVIGFFSRRTSRESKFFFNGSQASFRDTLLISDAVDINSDEFAQRLATLDPEIIFTFGCGILKNDWYFSQDRKVLNLHSGLIPEYRGVDSVYWCIHNSDFERIGFTIHFIDRELDMGKILLSRPLHSDIPCSESKTFFKVIREAVSEYPEIIDSISLNRELSLSIPQNSNKIYYEKDRGIVTDIVVWKNLFLKKVKELIHGKKSG
jgi:methionyl-tRNA formyltransferase